MSNKKKNNYPSTNNTYVPGNNPGKVPASTPNNGRRPMSKRFRTLLIAVFLFAEIQICGALPPILAVITAWGLYKLISTKFGDFQYKLIFFFVLEVAATLAYYLLVGFIFSNLNII